MGESSGSCKGRRACSICPRGGSNPFCVAVGDRTRAELCAASRALQIGKGTFFSVANIKDEVCVFRSGVAAALISSEKGKNLAIYVAEPGIVANIMRVAGDTMRHRVDFNDSHLAVAITDLQGCVIPIEVVRSCFMGDPGFAMLVLAQVTDHYKDALESMAALKGLSGEERIAWLLDRFEQVGVDSSAVTHETMAHILGMNRVSVTRLMGGALANRGRNLA